MGKFIDMAGKTFGRLTVTGLADASDRRHWRCVCSCGEETVTTGTGLRSGRTRSCGCLHRDITRARGRAKRAMPATNCSRWITADGATHTLTMWAMRLGSSPSCISDRLKRGWSEEDAVLTPLGNPRGTR